MKFNKSLYLLTSLGVLAIVSFLLNLCFGSVALSAHDIYTSFAQNNPLAHEILWQIRFPRFFSAFITGGLLALAGCLLQTLLGNALADPYVLGISGGSAVASLLAIFFGVSVYYLHAIAFIGGLIAMVIVFKLSYQQRQWAMSRLLLTGIIFAAGCNAIISLILTLSPDSSLRGMMFWLLGDLSNDQLPWAGVIILIFAAIATQILARPLDLLSFGELKARSLGVNTKRLTLIIYLLSALLTATAVSIAGCIGFIGLITPHLIRLSGFYSHRILLPASILLGGILVSLADMLARTVIAPQQLPVGIITAFIGIPIFLILLRKT